MSYLRALTNNPRGTGADRQIEIYKQTGDINKVVELLMEQTMQGITLDAAYLSHDFLKFKMYEEAEPVKQGKK
jgi:carboxylate-amine ligase